MEKKKISSRIFAWCAMVLAIAGIYVVFSRHENWWEFTGVLLAFLAVFCNLLSVYMDNLPTLSRKLKYTAEILGILFLIAEIVLFAVKGF